MVTKNQGVVTDLPKALRKYASTTRCKALTRDQGWSAHDRVWRANVCLRSYQAACAESTQLEQLLQCVPGDRRYQTPEMVLDFLFNRGKPVGKGDKGKKADTTDAGSKDAGAATPDAVAALPELPQGVSQERVIAFGPGVKTEGQMLVGDCRQDPDGQVDMCAWSVQKAKSNGNQYVIIL